MNSVMSSIPSMDKKILIGTFVRSPYVPSRIIRNVQEIFDPDRIFIFSVKNDETNKRLITFNIDKNDMGDRFSEYKKIFKNTLRLHRRKDSNTFYTLNSLNKVVKDQNGGSEDKQFEVDWTNFKNCCLVLDKGGNVKALETKLAKIIETYDDVDDNNTDELTSN